MDFAAQVHGRGQRDARLVLGRRPLPRPRRPRWPTASSWLAEGAAILDVGGESTRPGAEPVGLDEELRARGPGGAWPGRAACRHGDPVDRHHARPRWRARRWRRAPRVVNDVSALRADPELAGVVAAGGRGLLPDAHARRAAHDAGRPALRRRGLRGQGVPGAAAGVRGRPRASTSRRVWLDPGIGFGKTARAQPGAAGPPGRDRRAGPAGGGRHVAQDASWAGWPAVATPASGCRARSPRT